MMSSDFSRNLTKYRRRCSLTQSQLAAQLNVIPQAVSKWENGSLPDPEFLPVLARTLGISLDVLFGLVEEREEPDLTGMIFERLRRTAPEARADVIMELFYAAMAAFKDEPGIRIQYPDHLEKEAYAEIRSNHELAIARLNEDLKYLCFLKIPEGGIDADMGDAAGTTRGLVNLFRTLANEDAITILHYLGSASRNRMQSAEYMSRQLGIPLERVQRVIDGLDRLGIVWRVSASIGDEPTIIYGYGHSAALVCMLTLAKTLVRYVRNHDFYIDTWNRGTFHMEESPVSDPVPTISFWEEPPADEK